jgi:DNA-binding HxlR family transcriptional regulator
VCLHDQGGAVTAQDAVTTGYEATCLTDAESGAAIRAVLDRVGDKWSLLVIGSLRHGALRFGELRRHIPGVSQRMLTLTLRQLERDGLLSRTVFGEVPLRVEYELTTVGHTLVAPSLALADWALANYPVIAASRERFDAE